MARYDIFLSHASEDKESIAEPLSEALKRHGLKVWLDVKVLQVGDQLSRALDQGLAKSDFGVVILSPHYFRKHYPEYELRGLLAKEAHGGKVILPIWHGVSRKEVEEFSLPLADRVALDSAQDSIDDMALEILAVARAGRIRPTTATREQSRRPARSKAARRPAKRTLLEEKQTQAPAPIERRSDAVEEEPPTYRRNPWSFTDLSRLGTAGERQTITAEDAANIVRAGGQKLHFHGDLDISPEAARELARFAGQELRIDGFWDLSPETLAGLTVWEGQSLSLHLEVVELAEARILAGWPGRALEIRGLRQLNCGAAELLAGWPGASLRLVGLQRLSPETAHSLASWSGDELALEDLPELPVEVARILTSWRGAQLSLRGIRKLPRAAVELLATWPGNSLSLRGLRRLSPAMARSLAAWCGQELDLSEVGRIPTRAARSLFLWKGTRLYLSGLFFSKGAVYYLKQWGDHHSVEGHVFLERRAELPPAPQEFGLLATLRRQRPDRSDSALPSPPRLRAAWSHRLRQRRWDAWRGASYLAGAGFLQAAMFLGVPLWALSTKPGHALLGVLRPEEGPTARWTTDLLAVPQFLACLLLILCPSILVGIHLFGAKETIDDFLRPFAEVGKDVQKSAERALLCGTVIGPLLTFCLMMHLVFPGFLSAGSLKRAFAPATGPTSLGDGLWHGFFSLPRALFVQCPPNAPLSVDWIFYYPGYLLGLLATLPVALCLPFLVVGLFSGFDSKREREITEKSLLLEASWTCLAIYLLWCIVLAVWAALS